MLNLEIPIFQRNKIRRNKEYQLSGYSISTNKILKLKRLITALSVCVSCGDEILKLGTRILGSGKKMEDISPMEDRLSQTLREDMAD